MIGEIHFRNSLHPAGRWTLGEPVGANGFEKLPKTPSLATAATPAERLDVRTADAALGMKPRRIYDAWQETVAVLRNFVGETERLGKQGYTLKALDDATWRFASETTVPVLREAAGTAFDAAEFITKNRTRLATEYFEPAEDDVARPAYDVALAAKYAGAEPSARTELRANPDPRVLAALQRVPRALSGISDAELRDMQAEYVRQRYPHATSAFEALQAAAECLQMAVATGLGIVEAASQRKRAEVVATWGPAGRWVIGEA